MKCMISIQRALTMAPLKILALAVTCIIVACGKSKSHQVFPVAQRSAAPLPGLPGLRVAVADIHVNEIEAIVITNQAGKEIARGGPLAKKGVLPFTYEGKTYRLVVDRIIDHLTHEDYVYFYVDLNPGRR